MGSCIHGHVKAFPCTKCDRDSLREDCNSLREQLAEEKRSTRWLHKERTVLVKRIAELERENDPAAFAAVKEARELLGPMVQNIAMQWAADCDPHAPRNNDYHDAYVDLADSVIALARAHGMETK